MLIVTEDTVIRGVRELRNCRQLEVFGYLEGDVAAKSVLVHPNGRLFGKLKSDNATIHGTLQGDVVVKLMEQHTLAASNSLLAISPRVRPVEGASRFRLRPIARADCEAVRAAVFE